MLSFSYLFLSHLGSRSPWLDRVSLPNTANHIRPLQLANRKMAELDAQTKALDMRVADQRKVIGSQRAEIESLTETVDPLLKPETLQAFFDVLCRPSLFGS